MNTWFSQLSWTNEEGTMTFPFIISENATYATCLYLPSLSNLSSLSLFLLAVFYHPVALSNQMLIFVCIERFSTYSLLHLWDTEPCILVFYQMPPLSCPHPDHSQHYRCPWMFLLDFNISNPHKTIHDACSVNCRVGLSHIHTRFQNKILHVYQPICICILSNVSHSWSVR